MGLESATFISQLNPNNPVHATDPVSQGDDHLRLIKSTLLNSFPGITGAVTATHTELNNLDGVTGKTGSGKLVLDTSPTIASPTVTGTLTAADVTASGTITGNLFSGSGASLTSLPAAALTGTIADARLSSNVPLIDAANLFEATQTVTNTNPSIRLHDSDGDASEKYVQFRVNSGSFVIETLGDDASDGANLIVGTLDAGTWTELRLNATSITANGSAVATAATACLLAGTQTITGAKTFSAAPTFSAGATFGGDLSLSGTRTIDATTRLNLTGGIVSVGENNGTLGFFGAEGVTKRTVSGTGDEVGTLARSIATALQSMGLVTFQT